MAAFVLILAAGAARVLTTLQALPWRVGLEVAATLWVAAFAMFLLRYTSVLTSPRADGKPG